MAARGQIRGAVVDGPLAMDDAMDVEGARTKGIASLVAGHVNVLIVPNLEPGISWSRDSLSSRGRKRRDWRLGPKRQ
jgi:hypothetical protein